MLESVLISVSGDLAGLMGELAPLEEEEGEREAKLLEYSAECEREEGLGAWVLTGLGEVDFSGWTVLGELGLGARALTGLGEDDILLSRTSSLL